MLIDIGGTHIHYYLFCKRKLWLYVHNINMEHTSEIVKLGKLIEDMSYERRSEKNKQILLGSIKIDYINKYKKIIHETKLSSKNLDISIWQMKYYLYVIGGNWRGVIEIPSERKKEFVELNCDDISKIKIMIQNISEIINDVCPEKENILKCKKCSYRYLCYS
jgi:CRISPR-associated exonuclease Cas4